MRILIAEDDPVSRHLLKKTLEKWGYEVVATANGSDAWRTLQSEGRPHLVILDWMMPEMDGLELCRTIRSSSGGSYVYVILLTARTQKEDLAAAFDAGADDYLTKPFDAIELRARLRAGLRILNLQAELLQAQERLRVQATHDALTGVWNRAAIFEMLEAEWARAVRQHAPISAILADLDHFKRVNDTSGHLVGDGVLHECARRMQDTIRPYDNIGRYGGEEFLMVFPGCTMEHAARVAERLREAVCIQPMDLGGTTAVVTASFGVATCANAATQDLPALLRAADEALYAAKRNGRNRVEAVLVEAVSVENPAVDLTGETTFQLPPAGCTPPIPAELG